MKSNRLKFFFGMVTAICFLLVSCEKNGGDSDFDPEIKVMEDQLSSQAGESFVSVRADGRWSLQLFFGDQEPWAEINPVSGEGSKNNIILSYRENTSGKPRMMEICLSSSGKEFIQSISQKEKSAAVQPGDPENGAKWLELPSDYMCDREGMFRVTHRARLNGREQRNYTILYDSEMYTSYWVAYPLCHAHMGSGRNEDWRFDPAIGNAYQTSVERGYGVSLSTEHNSSNFYARGHQLPNADRSAVREMQYQTYYSTNITPQIHRGFNEHIWAELEWAVRNSVKADTVYVVTGACFQKKGAPRQEIKKIRNRNDGKMIPVPNYYWKVLLKVRRDGRNNITDATTVGFWLPHQDLMGQRYASYVTSVDQIEEWTGFDLFANLPEALQTRTESQKDWSAFFNF